MNTRGQGLDDTGTIRTVGKNYLFAVAIDRYLHSPPLYNCVGDARRIISLLQKEYQFDPAHTYQLFNEEATEKNIFDTFKELVKIVQPEDNLLILYSGHGEFEADIDEGYWIPVDAQLGDFSDYVSNGRIVKYLRAIQAHHILLIVDSCFSGTLFAHRNVGESHSALRLDDIPSRWLITAGRNEVVSDGKPGDHSPFADNIIYFLEHNPETSLSVGDLSDAVIDAVVFNSRQTPRGEPLQDVGHRGGQFFFHRKGYIPTPPPTEDKVVDTVVPAETPATGSDSSTKRSGGSGFWIIGMAVVVIIAIALVAGSVYTPEKEVQDDPEEEEALVVPEDYSSRELPKDSIEAITSEEEQPTTPADTPSRIQQAWTAVQNADSEEAYRRFIDRFPKSRLAKEAEDRIAARYRYSLAYGPTLYGGKEIILRFSNGQPPFRIEIIKPNQEKVIRSWDSKDAFRIDLGEIEKVNSGLNVLKVIVTDYNYKKGGHALPVY